MQQPGSLRMLSDAAGASARGCAVPVRLRRCGVISEPICGHYSASRRALKLPRSLSQPSGQDDISDDRTASSLPRHSVFESLGIMPEGRAQRAHFSQEILQQISDLPGTQDLVDLTIRADALALWKSSLQKGTLPAPGKLQWPQEPFCSRLMEALSTLEMPRFTRCNPKLVEPLLKQILSMTHTFEERMLELEAEREQKKQQQQQQQANQQGQPASSSSGEGEYPGDQAGDDDEDGQDGAASASSEAVAPGGENQSGEADSNSTQELQVQMDSEELQSKASEGQPGRDEEEEEEAAVEELAQTVAEEILEKWEEEMAPVMEHLEDAQQFLGNLDPLLDAPKGWDLSKSVWSRSGWKELKELRQKLERLRELRDLVRSLGRGGGLGPLRRAPEEIYSSAFPQGVIRDPSSPEETSGLTRSGDLSRMLPSEAALLAVGWPRQSVEESEEEVESRGNRAARLLHLARRAERQLLSYERCGWVDDQPARLTHRQEFRPAAELGPIIVCLDTSGSMNGVRETVAKALVLECMRGAHRQQRNCLVYAFSGPGQVQELELSVDVPSLERLLDFLECSFSGGTDVDAPFERSLDRLEKAEWSQADILMVTDGEIRPPKARLLKRLEAAQEDLGLQVHGLLVGNDVTPAMEELCTHLHLFKSWSAVGRPRSVY